MLLPRQSIRMVAFTTPALLEALLLELTPLTRG